MTVLRLAAITGTALLFGYFVTACSHSQSSVSAASVKPGKDRHPAPDFSLKDSDGKVVHLSDYRGKVVLLDFWATWCGYCREALPSIELLHRGLKDKVAVFGIDDEAADVARDYLQKFGYTLPTLIDLKDTAVNLYHLDGWPTTVLIDSEGKIAFYEVGFEAEKLRDALRKVGVW